MCYLRDLSRQIVEAKEIFVKRTQKEKRPPALYLLTGLPAAYSKSKEDAILYALLIASGTGYMYTAFARTRGSIER